MDKEKEPFEALSPQIREFLLNRGAALSGNYVDYLYSIISALILEQHFSITSLDIQIAKTARSKNTEIKPLDNNKSVAGHWEYFIPQTEEINEITEMEIKSDYMDEFIRSFSGGMFTQNPLPQFSKEAYLSGNTEIALQLQDIGIGNKEIEFLLKDRNELWFQKIIEAFEANEYENIFVAGGAMHLIGPFNLLDMLEEEGFIIKRLSCSE